jgi:copper oxidase (laccase) domain-containing protein
MIAGYQPTIFAKNVTIAVSSVDDGNMKFDVNEDKNVATNRQNFLQRVGISLDQATPVTVSYDRDDYADYRIANEADKGKAMRRRESIQVADALVVIRPNHALFLSVADCCAVVFHDPVKDVLMLSHIGRHSAEVDGARRSVEFLQQNCNSKPADLKIWLSPAVGKVTYPIIKKDGKGLHEVILDQLAVADVPRENIEVCDVDTATDPNYFSHSEFKKGNQKVDGRFAVVAMMNGRSETAS